MFVPAAAPGAVVDAAGVAAAGGDAVAAGVVGIAGLCVAVLGSVLDALLCGLVEPAAPVVPLTAAGAAGLAGSSGVPAAGVPHAASQHKHASVPDLFLISASIANPLRWSEVAQRLQNKARLLQTHAARRFATC
ncbi:MAG TPA: hypothetical protein VMF89_31985 [Polyangiales bacterium]|nr:hypothetical protein [Polyangiales bacterium]